MYGSETKLDLTRNAWFAGFVDGEGCFCINRRGNAFVFMLSVSQRADSIHIINRIRAAFGGSTSGIQPSGGVNPKIQWEGSSRKVVGGLIAYFDEYQLLVKGVQFEYWKQAALLYYKNAAGGRKNPDWLIQSMEKTKEQLSAMKLYYGERTEDFLLENDIQLNHIARQVVARAQSPRIEFDDVLQEARIGAMKAHRRAPQRQIPIGDIRRYALGAARSEAEQYVAVMKEDLLYHCDNYGLADDLPDAQLI